MPKSWNLPDGTTGSFGDLTEELVDTARVAFLVLDTDGKILHVNAFLSELVGFEREELIGRGWFDAVILEDEGDAVRAVFRRALSGEATVGNINSIRTKSGGTKRVEWYDRLLKDIDGKVVGVLVVGRDITSQMEVESRLRDSEERATAVMETAVNAIITMNESRLIQTVNSSAESLFGYTSEEMVGNNVSMLMPSPYREAHDGYVNNYISSGQKRIIGIGREVVGQRKDGSTFSIDLSVGEATLSDGSRLFTGIIRDLTQRKRLEEKILEISEEEQRRIGRDIHDDLCQQLAGITCLAQVLQKRLEADGVDGVDDLEEIAQLVGNANARAREMSRGLVPVIREADGLATALETLAGQTSRMFGVDCRFTCPEVFPIADNKLATQVFRVAQEAVSNACRHGEAEKIEILLERDGLGLALSVADDGVGMSDEPSGPGLGMLTMEHRVKMLGGHLHVRSAKGGGTTVSCRIPLMEVDG